MHRILVVHGPNLNALGTREPELYGHDSLNDIDRQLQRLAPELDCEVECLQSNHEGAIIDALYQARGRSHGVLLNPGGLTHTSIALGDAVRGAGLPVVEVHLSNPHAREPFRHQSFVSGGALGVVQGFGAASYMVALRALAGHLAGSTPAASPSGRS
jgi:3-dehydroquinate dehydratase-2